VVGRDVPGGPSERLGRWRQAPGTVRARPRAAVRASRPT